MSTPESARFIFLLHSLAAALAAQAGPRTETARIDDCQYADNAAAQAVWRPMAGTESVAVTTVDGRRALRLPCNFAGTKIERASWDRPVTLDLGSCRGIQFRLFCPDDGPVSQFSLYFQSGAGWYHAVFSPETSGRWNTIAIDKTRTTREGNPAGWGQIKTIRISAWRGKDVNTEFYLSDMEKTGVLGVDTTVAVLRAESAQGWPEEARSVEQYTEALVENLSALEVSCAVLGDLGLTADRLKAAQLVILPHNPRMPERVADELARYVRDGGKLLAFYTIPDKLCSLLGVQPGRHLPAPRPGYFTSIRFADQVLPGAPGVVGQRSWNIQVVQPVPGTSRVLAEWFDDQGQATGYAAVLGSSNGIVMTHVLLPDDPGNKRRMLLAMVGRLVPEVWRQTAEAGLERIGRIGGSQTFEEAVGQMVRTGRDNGRVTQAVAAARELRDSALQWVAQGRYAEALDEATRAQGWVQEAFCLAQQSWAGEFRAFWCHSAFGVEGMDWDEAVGRLAENGFTAILPNMLWGGVAFYESNLLPRAAQVSQRGDQITQCLAACRKHGLQMHVWKVNWNLGSGVPDEFLEKMRRAGRLQANSRGEETRWLCPSHPENQKLEVDSMIEVVRRYEVDGIHFDYIRYPDGDHCFCAGCKERFQRTTGSTRLQWPQDALAGGPLRQAWLDWRRGNITAVVRAVSEQARALQPKIKISAAVFRHWSTDRDGVGQDWKLWCEQGYLDFVCPMDYTPSSRGFEGMLEQQLRWAGRTPCYPGIGVSASSSRFGVDRTIEQINITRRHQTRGFVIFNYGPAESRELLPLLGLGITARRQTLTNSLGMTLVRIEPGRFQRGSAEGDFDEQPVHEVTLRQPCWLAATEVNNAQYEQFDPAHRKLRGKLGFSNEDQEAVVFVSWPEAMAFCAWLSAKEGKPYRLPTEAEWEYACRAGTTTAYHTGAELPEVFRKNARLSWFPGERTTNDVVPLHTGMTPPNPWGLFDMHGNVEEWCLDWYGPYPAQPQTDPVGCADGPFRVTRGGSHSTPLHYLRAANRSGTLPEDKSWLIGFRVVQGEKPLTEPLPPPPPPRHARAVEQRIPPDLTLGPDPAKPYFRGPRTFVHAPPAEECPLFNRHNHCPALVNCPNGDLLAIWYTCRTEPGRELGIVASRLPYGEEEWQLASEFWDAPDRNDHASALWVDEEGRLYHFNGLSAAATWGSLATILRTSSDNGATWSRARLIMPEHGLHHMPVESVIRSREGALLVPCDAVTGGSGGTAVLVSRDQGQTWTDPGEGRPNPEFRAGGLGAWIAGIHAGFVQLSDGRLLALGRGDNIDGRMPMSLSADLGQNWTYRASPFPPLGGGQRLVILRLREGPILFCSFGRQIRFRDASGNEQVGSGLFAALSRNEGESWEIKRLITDDGPPRTVDGGGNTGHFTLSQLSAEPKGYLSICQAANGLIHLISSKQHYVFNLAWVTTPPPPPPEPEVPGIVIDYSPASSGLYIGSPSIVILPTGEYLASHDFFGPKSAEFECPTTRVFRSADRGLSWKPVAQLECLFWPGLFTHRGATYLMGTDKHHGRIVIRRSIDAGVSWTEPRDGTTGLLTPEGQYHTAPVPVIEHDGRLWRAFEDAMGGTQWGKRYRALMFSVPVDADLLNAAHWTFSNPLPRDPAWLNGEFNAWLEGNAVLTPDHRLVNILRVDTPGCPEKAAVVDMSSDGKTASFNPTTGFIPFPGGAKKFTIRFDPQSRRYWSLATLVPEQHEKDGRPGGIRNTLALTCSPDLRQWEVRSILLYHPDVKKHGFQYADWQFDGDDLVAAVRMAYDDGRGGAPNNHDANFLTFHRIAQFRTRTMADSVPIRKLD